VTRQRAAINVAGMCMRIGTWNLAAKWSGAHQALLVRQDCDVWLLTEVHPKACIADYHCCFSAATMVCGQHYAAVLSRWPLQPLADPHAASAAAVIDDVTYCATILPWAGCAKQSASPWVGASLEDMARAATDQLAKVLPKANTVWGGDWNQNLAGGWQNVGSGGVRAVVESAVSALGLLVPTAGLPHQRSECLYTIDHIALPHRWNFHSAARVTAVGLSDHDVYIIDAEPA
jgi:hypothetical protein